MTATPPSPRRPRLKIRRVNMDTGRENVVVISRRSTALRPDVFRGFSRVELRANSKVLLATLLLTDDGMVAPDAMANAGTRLKWDHKIVVDKHCIGGIPGNRTSIIVVPIFAAHGLMIPKTSSRAITPPAGTADTRNASHNRGDKKRRRA
jgi:hypothetical protein